MNLHEAQQQEEEKTQGKGKAEKKETRGAGVNPDRVLKMSKRMKAAYRKTNRDIPFREFCRTLAQEGVEEADAFLSRKKSGSQADAKKARRERVRIKAAQARKNSANDERKR